MSRGAKGAQHGLIELRLPFGVGARSARFRQPQFLVLDEAVHGIKIVGQRRSICVPVNGQNILHLESAIGLNRVERLT